MEAGEKVVKEVEEEKKNAANNVGEMKEAEGVELLEGGASLKST